MSSESKRSSRSCWRVLGVLVPEECGVRLAPWVVVVGLGGMEESEIGGSLVAVILR